MCQRASRKSRDPRCIYPLLVGRSVGRSLDDRFTKRCAYNYLPTGTFDGVEGVVWYRVAERVVHPGLHSFRMARSGIFRSARLVFPDLDANASDNTLFAHLTRMRREMRRVYLVDGAISAFLRYS